MKSHDLVNILLVDDRPDNLTVVQAVLDSPNYNLILANSGFEAVELSKKTDFAAVLLDVQMPGKDGFQTAKEIREQPLCRNVPIIFVTAIYGDEIYANMGYDAGAVDYIFKPFNPHVLRSKVSVFAELYLKSKKLILHQELLREVERKERAREMAEVHLRGIKRENSLQQKYIDLVNSIDHCIIWAADAETMTFTFMSPKSEELTGFKISESVGVAGFCLSRLHADDKELFFTAAANTRQGQEVSFEHRCITKTGKVIWLKTTMRLARTENGGSEEIHGMSVDITDLRASEELLRFLADAGTQLAQSLSYDVTIKEIVELAVPDYATSAAIYNLEENGEFKKIAATGDFQDDKNFPNQLDSIKNGKSQLYHLTSGSIALIPMATRTNLHGFITFISKNRRYKKSDMIFFEDFTRRSSLALENATLYKQAQEAIHAKDEFLSIASHELRTPLTPLKIQFQTMTKLINEGKFNTVTPERLGKMLVRSDRQLDRLNDLIEDLLNVSRINLKRMNLNLKKVNVVPMIRDVAEQFKDQLLEAGCTLTLDLEPQIVGNWDIFKIEQVIINLLTNAIKYGRGKPIHIHGDSKGDTGYFYVKDGGIGIDEKDQERIFGLFERAVSPQHCGGLGLGLYIVKNIIQEHKGRIYIESKLEKGSKFVFELPKNLETAKQEREFHEARP